jgi:hypothetical protein
MLKRRERKRAESIGENRATKKKIESKGIYIYIYISKGLWTLLILKRCFERGGIYMAYKVLRSCIS